MKTTTTALLTILLLPALLPVSSVAAPRDELLASLAAAVTPTRYTDPAKVEKWFKRNCQEVLGRQCTPLEKGDWLSAMISQ